MPEDQSDFDISPEDLFAFVESALLSAKKIHCGSPKFAKAVRHRAQRLRRKYARFCQVKFYVDGPYLHAKRPIGRPIEIFDSEGVF